jgi:polyhydroxyalkanoate synthase
VVLRLSGYDPLHSEADEAYGCAEKEAREDQMVGWGKTPFEIGDYDNPETIRFRKYATGTHILLREAPPETGQTPREEVWAKGKARLYRYEPEKRKYPVPVVLVYALILRPYILDLVPGNSFIEYLLGRGFEVYLLDWGVPDAEDKNLSFEHYVLDYLPEALEKVLGASRVDGVTLFGYCQGGTMSVMYASLFPEHLKNLVLLATPVDFAPDDPGPFGLWTLWSRSGFFDPDPLVETFGNAPDDLRGRLLEESTRLPWLFAHRTGANVWDRPALDKAVESFLAVSKWVDDGVPFPGEAFRRWIKDFYQQNKLVKGELELRGRRIYLSNIGCPVLNVAGEKDYICPVSQTEATMDLVSSEDRESLVVDAGHVGLMGGRVASEELWPRVADWLEPRSR